MLRAIKAGNAKHQQERRTICTQKVFLLPECVIILQKIKIFPLITYSCASSTNEVRGRHQKRKRPLVFSFRERMVERVQSKVAWRKQRHQKRMRRIIVQCFHAERDVKKKKKLNHFILSREVDCREGYGK